MSHIHDMPRTLAERRQVKRLVFRALALFGLLVLLLCLGVVLHAVTHGMVWRGR